MSYYECVFIARQELSTTQAEQLTDQMAEILVKNGGEVKGREYWGLKNLAYRIKKNRKGHYTMFHMDAPSDAVIEMERNMGLSEDVLRHLTIRLDELPEGPSIMMQAKSDRGDRGRRPDRPDRPDRDRPQRFDQDHQGDAPRAERATEAAPDDAPKAEPDAS